jgi:hypothetical protein
MQPDTKPYRILSLDGGGTWALMQVMALQQLYSEHAHGHEVLKDFDLVAANSGGSITAGGLVTNLPLSEILGYFCEDSMRSRIFNPLPFALAWGSPFQYIFHKFVRAILPVGAKYRTKEKLRGLNEVLQHSDHVFRTKQGKKITDPDYELWEIPDRIRESRESGGKSPDFLIVGFNYDRRRAKFFRSNPNSLSSGSPGPEHASLSEAIHASTNAPVNFFVSPAVVANSLFWDGAIAGLNNPVLAGVTEALANGIEESCIQVLSLGTGTISLPAHTKDARADAPYLLQKRRHSTLFGDVAELSTSILDDPPDTATFVSHVILSPSGLVTKSTNPMENPVVRMAPVVRPMRTSHHEKWTLPTGFTKEEFLGLVDLDLDATTPEEIALLTKLANAWIAGDIRNQAIREDAYYDPDIGHATFGEAMSHWKALKAIGPCPTVVTQASG